MRETKFFMKIGTISEENVYHKPMLSKRCFENCVECNFYSYRKIEVSYYL